MLTQPITTQITIEEAALRILRREGMLIELCPCSSGGVVDVMCPDPTCFWQATGYIQETHREPMTPQPILGGAMRMSEFCPRPYNLPIWQVEIQEFRARLRLVGAHKARFDVHGDHCRWAAEQGLGIIQRIWLNHDARFRVKRMAEKEHWLADGDLEIFCTFHRRPIGSICSADERTYLINPKHDLLRHWPIHRVMLMADRDFIEAMDPMMLAHMVE